MGYFSLATRMHPGARINVKTFLIDYIYLFIHVQLVYLYVERERMETKI